MRILVTGHLGYIGTCLVPRLLEKKLHVVGSDTDFYKRCTYGPEPVAIANLDKDIRDLVSRDLTSFDAIIHLAGLSNDPLGELNPRLTAEINHLATVKLARQAKLAGVRRFLFSSSCSTYGAAGEEFVSEDHPFNPVTSYGHSKVLAEKGLSDLADESFAPTYLRNATVYGYSPRIRFDLVINNLVAWAHTSGKVLLKSQGLAWRPLVHVEDVADAFIAILQAPVEDVHDQAFNIGLSDQNYRVIALANKVVAQVPGAVLDIAPGAEADTRTYRVNCDKARETLPSWNPRWNVDQGIASIYGEYRAHGLELSDFEGSRFARVAHLKSLLETGALDTELRWANKA